MSKVKNHPLHLDKLGGGGTMFYSKRFVQR